MMCNPRLLAARARWLANQPEGVQRAGIANISMPSDYEYGPISAALIVAATHNQCDLTLDEWAALHYAMERFNVPPPFVRDGIGDFHMRLLFLAELLADEGL